MKVLFLALCLLVCVQDVFLCSCLPRSPTQLYCDAEYMIAVEIEEAFTTPSFDILPMFDFPVMNYQIRVLRVFKRPNGVRFRRFSSLYTGSNSAMCGVTHLESDERYLITGYMVEAGGETRLHTNSCSMAVQYTRPMPPPYRRLIRRRRRLNCQEISILPIIDAK